MARIALICPEFRGHLNPTTCLGRALQARGHEAVLLGHVDAEELATRSGLEFRRIGSDSDEGWAAGETQEFARFLGRTRGLAATWHTLRALSRQSPVHLRDLPIALREEHVDAAIVDQVCVAASTACDLTDVPFASLANALTTHRSTTIGPVTMPWGRATGPLGRTRNRLVHAVSDYLFGRLVGREVHRARSRAGMRRWRLEESFSTALQLAQQPAWFDFPRDDLPDHFHYTGPFHTPDRDDDADEAFPFDRLDGRPLVYASMGTLQNGLAPVFRSIAEAVAPLDAQLVLALGGADLDLGPLPGDPIVVRYAPQLRLLERAAVAITHAGLNGTLEALTAGVPLLALPVANDQPGVAARIEHAGVGLVLRPARRSVPEIRSGVQSLLADDTLRDLCARRATSIREMRALDTAVDLIETDLLATPTRSAVSAGSESVLH